MSWLPSASGGRTIARFPQPRNRDKSAQFYEAKFAGEPFCSQPLELRIHHPDAARPCDISQTSKDTRRLALAVKRLTLVRFLAPGT